MFKKLKDKLTEEVKIPSQKFTQSMQQLAQAVVSPVSSNNSSYDAASNENFSIDGDFDDTPQSTPTKKPEGGVAYRGGQATPLGNSFESGSGAGFTHVDLQQGPSGSKTPSGPTTAFSDAMSSLRSSVSSLASDSSFMFPVLESSGPTYNFQSDLESCSEASESVGPNINKEQLVSAYQKVQQRYHKYKGRYADLARHYRDLERDNKNAKHILTECQDKALRRMAELKEQCSLEKQAKAHLEEALRSDLEEKDHLIHTLKTKIKLLRNQVDQVQVSAHNHEKSAASASVANVEATEEIVKPARQEDLLTSDDSGPAAAVLTPEPANVESENVLKEKVKKLESLLHKCKEDITNKRETIKQLESDKQSASAKIDSLQQQLITIQKREEEASLSLAKNKQTIHRELETKEEEIKKLNVQLAAMNSRVSELQTEVTQIKDESKKELAAGKMEATKLIKAEMEELMTQNRTLEDRLAAREYECQTHEERAAELLNRLDQCEAELNPLKKSKDELLEKFTEETRLLKEQLSNLHNKDSKKDTRIEELKPILKSVQDLNGVHSQLKSDMSKVQSDSMLLVNQQKQLIEEKIKTLTTDFLQEHRRVISELEEYKRESANARESLATVSNKFVLLEQTISSEKTGVESKITDLQKELVRAENKISSLEQSLDSEKAVCQSVEEELLKKLSLLEKELSDERNTSKQETASAELKYNDAVEQLKEQLKEMEQDRTKITEVYNSAKEKAEILQHSIDLLQQELKTLQTSKSEAENQISSLRKLLEDKTEYNEELKNSLSELKTSLEKSVADFSATLAEKTELEHRIRDIEEKKLSESDDSDVKIVTMQRENEEKDKQIVSLKSIIQDHEVEAQRSNAKNNELEIILEELNKKIKGQESSVSSLQESNEALSQSLQQLQSEIKEKTDHINMVENASAGLQTVLAEKYEQASNFAKLEAEFHLKTEECKSLTNKLEELNVSHADINKMLQLKVDECNSLAQEVENLKIAQTEQMKMLQQKSDDSMKLTAQIENLMTDVSNQNCNFEEKVKECEDFQTKLSCLEREQAMERSELKRKEEECLNMIAQVNSLEKEKLDYVQILNTKNAEIESFALQLESFRQKYMDQVKILEEKSNECSNLSEKLETLINDNARTVKLLQQKTIECEDKEEQLDSLADEMKRVEELSQELHRINDDRDANVEVLSTEASSLAEKVEELTASTQDLKEREVDLLAKLQVAQDLEAEYISMKQREEMLLLKLNEAKTFETELRANEEDLKAKSKQIKELEEENTKLKEAGQNLSEIINRAKEAETKCEKLQNDGAGLLLRIQRAEDSEIRCSLLEEEINAMKKERAEMLQEIESLQSKSVFRENTSEEVILDTKEPVVEEPCIVKRFADLTENQKSSDGDIDTALLKAKEWEERYNKLVDQHNKVLQENAESIERLKEENLMAVTAYNAKQKERLWDRLDTGSSLPDGNTNGAFGAVEKLQQQLAAVTTQLKENKKQHRQEVDDLRRILLSHGSSNSHSSSSRSDNLEDATELEYLRNILYEYMMGKEPMILARVIAAVVKFDSEQTSKVLQKEQQRLSLLGHLGIS